MSQWKTVKTKKGSKAPKVSSCTKTQSQQSSMTEAQIRRFLSSFKTSPCEAKDFHDHRLCQNYHDFQKDGRRDPYKVQYGVDDSSNLMERMYHPVVFRTSLCMHTSCPFKSTCAHAHREADLRSRESATDSYIDLFEPNRKLPVLAAFLPQVPQRNYVWECHEAWQQVGIQTESFFVGLNQSEQFLLKQSKSLFNDIQEKAFEEGLCCVAWDSKAGKAGITVKGLDVEPVVMYIRECFVPPSQHFERLEEDYTQRIIESIAELLRSPKGRSKISTSNCLHIETFPSRSRIRFLAVNSKSQSAQDLVKGAKAKIDFWIEQENYHRFATCGCCMEDWNLDQGIACPAGHFYCSHTENQCFASLINSQINQIRTSEEGLVCPECRASYRDQDVASHLPEQVWNAVQDAIVSKRVEKRSEALAREFDERLQARVNEIMQKYTNNPNGMLKFKAQQHALEIRNTIMNLCCPHCKIAYAEFSGCMALQCQTCQKHFCGYCHNPFDSGHGAHSHVRECLMNETQNGSYYASAEEIERAQRLYRTRTIKKFLRKFKKDLQNAIVIELGSDLEDVGIQPNALFEVGNIQDEIYQAVEV